MHTKILMTLSALLMALLGLAASFLPQELLAHYGFGPDRHAALLIQVFGAAYLGFAMLNWMARHNLIGGIYSRPVAMGNMIHFVVAALALLKAAMSGSARTSEMIGAALVYTIFRSLVRAGRVRKSTPESRCCAEVEFIRPLAKL